MEAQPCAATVKRERIHDQLETLGEVASNAVPDGIGREVNGLGSYVEALHVRLHNFGRFCEKNWFPTKTKTKNAISISNRNAKNRDN